MRHSYFRRHAKILARYGIVKLKEITEYKLDLVMSTVGLSSWFLAMFFYWRLILGDQTTLAGWTLPELFLLPLFGQLIFAILGIFWGGIHNLWRDVTDGTFDKHLARPVNPLVGQIANYMGMWGFIRVSLILMIMLGVIIAYPSQVSILSVLLAFLVSIMGVLVYTAIVVLLHLSAFWIGDNRFLDDATAAIERWMIYPLNLFPKGMRVFFTYIFPIMFITVFPVKILFNQVSWHHILYILGALGLLLSIWTILLIALWRKALGRYESGGG
jgi:ABC-2 type transport system permease protein